MSRMQATYDVIVVGLGGMGSAAAYHLARRGVKVLGLEAHGPGHTLGSSHGESRIIRMAYMEHPDYVPLLRRAYELWEELQAEDGAELLRLTGGLFIGPPDGHVVAGSLQSAQQHGLPHELLDADEIARRYPTLQPAPGDAALYEARAGILFPERCVEAHLRGAANAGADLRFHEPVSRWTAARDGIEVVTGRGQYGAQRVVFAPGSWLGKLLVDLRLPLRPERIPVFWLHPRERAELFLPERFPIYIWQVGDMHSFYGFPHLERPGVKVGRHHSGEDCDPDNVDRELRPEDQEEIRRFIRSRIPALDGPIAQGQVCLYTNTPDEHFLVDRHPELPSVVYAGGFSGHGFKFASVMGEVLADLATEGRATPAADFLRAGRLTLEATGSQSSTAGN
ncbi:MAG: N-methyl-L-tryptophan oxidase [Chloroflexota bacterium]|nr:N-methyl-L-tryptophan oxidase [Chloroflexota bacterium]